MDAAMSLHPIVAGSHRSVPLAGTGGGGQAGAPASAATAA